VRGIVEGFYGRPWDRRDRLDVLAFCAERGMDAYLYAPKDDPRHRRRWREPYEAAELAAFAELAGHCDGLGVRFGFAVSPGLDIDYGSAADRRALLGKLLAALEVGARWLAVAFDDVPGRAGLGARQAELVAWVDGELRARGPAVRLSMVPTEYAGVAPSAYLADLAAGLPERVEVAWTGPWIVSPTITAADARARAAAVGGRPPLLWDNYPVNDGAMSSSLFLGPYSGRDPDLREACSGILCNPMPLAHASKVALATAAEFLSGANGHDPGPAWRRAIAAVGGGRAAVLEAFAHACSDSALAPPSASAAHRLVDGLESGRASLADLAAFLGPARDAAAAVAADGGSSEPFWEEVRPWLDQWHLEARAGLAALRLMAAVGVGGPGDGADAPHAAEALKEAWSRARAGSPRNVFGPRFACYPAVRVGEDGAPHVDLDAGVVEDASAIDRLCRLAARAYRRWLEERTTRSAPFEATSA
jgi:hyaluronoglucosaminidase